VQVVHWIGAGLGSEAGTVRGFVFVAGEVVPDPDDVVLDPGLLPRGSEDDGGVDDVDDEGTCPSESELDPHAARPVDASAATTTAPKVVRDRRETAFVTRATLGPRSPEASAPRIRVDSGSLGTLGT
jgi:hypothetical protein